MWGLCSKEPLQHTQHFGGRSALSGHAPQAHQHRLVELFHRLSH